MRARRALAAALLPLALGACRQEGGTLMREVPGGDPERGRVALAQFGCGGCHVIPGVPAAQGRVGPSLDRVAERRYLAGQVPNELAGLLRWIEDPQGVQPGTAMPDLGVANAQARDMAAYLYTLDRSALGPPHLVPAGALPSH